MKINYWFVVVYLTLATVTASAQLGPPGDGGTNIVTTPTNRYTSFNPRGAQQAFQAIQTNSLAGGIASPAIVFVSAPTPVTTTGEIQIQTNGAIGQFAPHKAFFAPNPNTSEAIQLTIPDQSGAVLLKSHVVGIGFWDSNTGEAVLFATPQDCVGEVSGSTVRYTNALDGTDAEITYTYAWDSFDQTVVLRKKIPEPLALNMTGDPAKIRLVVITEFIDPPDPIRLPGTIDLSAKNQLFGIQSEDSIPDETLFFGSMRMAAGKMLLLGDSAVEIPSGKTFINVDESHYLVEFCPWLLVKALVDSLPSGTLHAKAKAHGELKSLMAQLPKLQPAAGSAKMRFVSPSSKSGLALTQSRDIRPGVVLDYLLVSTHLVDVDLSGAIPEKQGVAAVGRFTNDFWITWLSSNTSKTNLLWSDQSGSGIGLTIANAPGGWGNGANDPMYNSYLYGSPPISLTLTNLPTNVFNFYLYGHAARDVANSSFKLLRASQQIAYKGTTLWGNTWNTTNWEPGIQYQVFKNIAVTNQTIQFQIPAGGDGYPYVNGLQIVESAAVPPPPANITNLFNVNFGSPSTNKVGFAAVGLATNDYWNGYYNSSNLSGSIVGLINASGTASALGLTVLNAPGIGSWNGGGNGDGMYTSFVYATNGGNVTLLLTNLTTGNYDFYLYGHGNTNDANTIFQLWTGGRDWDVRGTTIWGSGYSNSTTWDESQQYIVYHDIPVDNNQVVTIVAGHDPYGSANLNGMQIVYKGSYDTNSDGLPDVWKWYYFGSTSTSGTTDTDSDLLSNFREFQLGTDPTKADTDGNDVNDADDSERVWVEDATPTQGIENDATAGSPSWSGAYTENWNWTDYWSDGWGGEGVGSYSWNPYSSCYCMHVSDTYSGIHQHWFDKSVINMMANTGEVLITYVNIDPDNPPSEIMLQWYATGTNGLDSWEHRAYWGSNAIAWGATNTASRWYVTNLPAAGNWTRLEVPASAVGLEGKVVQGMAFTLYNGRAAFDRAGKFIPDMDGNGLTDSWEQYYFGSIGQNPSADPDHDGLSNFDEFRGGTNPTNCNAPQISGQPQNTCGYLGGTAYFIVTPTGSVLTNYHFQWRLGGTNITSATNYTLVIANMQSTNLGNYTIVITNVCGSITSSVATLTFCPPPYVQITAPTNNSTFTAPALVPIQATATNTDSSVTNVEFYRGNLVLLSHSAAPPYSYIWNAAAGSYSLTAVAYDSHGLINTSTPVSITVASACGFTNTTFSSNNAFGNGFLENLNYTNTFGRLQLNTYTTPYPFFNVACGDSNTLVRLDTSTGLSVGEYRTAPTNKPAYPSAVAVDRFGNTWVANWDEAGNIDGTHMGSIARIGVVIGGTRGDIQKDQFGVVTNFVVNTNTGHYLKPPFLYSTAIDRDGDGYIKTSYGTNDVLSWTNTIGGIGNVADAEDELIINYVRVPAQLASALAVDANNDLWVGGYCDHSTPDLPGVDNCGSKIHVKVNGVTGEVITNTVFTNVYNGIAYGGFEGLIAPNGFLWSSGGANDPGASAGNRSLVVFDPVARTNLISTNSVGNYGIAVDPQTGNLWVAAYDSSNVAVYSQSGAFITNYAHGDTYGSGVAIDNQSNVWVAHGPFSGSLTLGHLRTDGTLLSNLDLTASCSDVGHARAVAFDANGKLWALCADTPHVLRINPATGQIEICIKVGSSHQTRGDLTGQKFAAGAPSGVWSVIYTNTVTSQVWGSVTWTASTTDTNQIRVEVRAANTYGQLSTDNFQVVLDNVPLTNVVGQLLEIRVTLAKAAKASTGPWLHDLTVDCAHQVNHAPIVWAGTNQTISLPQSQALLLVASVSDPDGPLGPYIAWSKVDGPGSVRFQAAGTTNAADIKASFTAAGDYTLKLSASDSQLSGSSNVVIHVTATNAGPTVSAGSDQTNSFPDYVYLPGTAIDDGLPVGSTLTLWWTNLSAGTVMFDDPHSAATMASFSAPGTYTLRLTATDGAITNHDDTTITVSSFSGMEIFRSNNVVSAGVGGLKETNRAIIHLNGIPGTVKRAYLYWHGPTDSADPDINSQVLFNGRLVTGRNIGIGHDNGWPMYTENGNAYHEHANSQAYRANVTELVAVMGNGDYVIQVFSKGYTQADELYANGASLIVFFDDPASTNKHDIVLWEGNNSTASSSFIISGTPTCLALQSDGNILVGGDFGEVGTDIRYNLARFLSNGIVDESYDPGQGVLDDQVNALVLQSDGKAIIGGDFTTVDGWGRTNVARVNTNASVDLTFDPGKGADNPINSILLRSDGKILVSGSFTNFNAVSRHKVALLDTNGALNSTFVPALDTNGVINCMALDGNGKLIIGGDFTVSNRSDSIRIARLNTDGSLDTSFALGTNYNGPIKTLGIDANGKIIIGGTFYDINGSSWSRIARLNTNGTLDTSFHSGDTANNAVLTIAIQDSTNILIGGDFTSYEGNSCLRIARLKSDGSFDATFNSGAGVSGGSVSIITQEANGDILIAGGFTQVDGNDRAGIARLDHNGHLLTGLNDANWHVQIPIQNYSSGNATLELHVSDGQPKQDGIHLYADPSLYLNHSLWWAPDAISNCNGFSDDTNLFAGASVPNYGQACGYSLWDIKERSITNFLVPGSQTLELDATNSFSDLLSLVVAMAKLPPGSITNSPAIPIVPTNLPPIAHPDSVNVHHGTLVKLIDVLNNDVSPSGTLLSIGSAGSPAHGTVEIVYDRSAILYTPQLGYIGADTFTYTAIDGNGNTGSASVTLNVDGPDPIPLACGQTVSGILGQGGGTTAFRGSGQPATFYKFRGRAGDQVTVNLRTTEFQSHIYLRNPVGKVLTTGTHHGKSTIAELDSSLSYTLDTTGTYTLEVTSHSLRESGTYTVEVDGGLSGTCWPQSIMQVWADGLNIPDNGVIDFGTSSNKTITIVNAGNSNYASTVYIQPYQAFHATPDFLLPPFLPGTSRSVVVTADQSNPGPTNEWITIAGIAVNLQAYVSASGNRPLIGLTNPTPHSIFYVPTDITLNATGAAQVVGATVTNVQFFATTPAGRVKLGETNNTPYTCVWQNPPVGTYLLSAWAFDSGGRVGSSDLVPITLAHRPPNHPPVAVDDFVNVFINTQTNVLNVLTNDYDPDGDALVITSVTARNSTNVTIAPGGKAILYQPLTNSYGDDLLVYTISDGHNGAASAKVHVTTVQTTVQITQPADYTQTNLSGQVGIEATASTSDGAIGRVEFYANNEKFGEAWNPPYTATFSSPNAGLFYITAVALDTRGFTVSSDPVYIRFSDSDDVPIANIANLTEGQVIREGSYDLIGTASNLDATATVSYAVRLYRPDDGVTPAEQRLVAELIHPTTARKANELLGHLDFSMVRNGGYVLELEVDNVDTMSSASVLVGIVIESNLKLGQFTFTEQDLVIPVSGIPLTVTRTYNSINPSLGDFGQSWTYGLNDVDMEIDEDRTSYPDYQDHNFNMRVGGGRDVTLTMPDGRRTTFNFYWTQGACNQGDAAAFCLFANWQAPYGINAKLTPLDDNRLVAFWGGNQWWQANSEAGVDNFDFSGFVLQTIDGTGYIIKRQPTGLHTYLLNDVSHSVFTYGKAVLTTITNRAGDRIELTSTNIQHFNSSNLLTRSLIIERTNHNLISAIRDPKTLTGWPALKYAYDGNNNLVAVYKLIKPQETYDTNAYLITRYHYTNVNFPHFLTGIDDPRGVPAARSLYDASGRLIQVTDAAGNTTTFEHDLENRREIITDPLTNHTTHVFDERGNVTATIDALGHTTSRTYDYNNNVASESDELNHTTAHTYDNRGLVLSTIDPLGHTNSITYDSTYGQPITVTDPLGNVTTNVYDSAGNLTATMRLDPQGNIIEQSSSAYRGSLLTATFNANGDTTGTFSYDSYGSLTASTDARNFSHNFTYDENGNQTNSTYTWAGPGGSVTVTNITQYDAQGRVTLTIDGQGNTNRSFYNSLGKVDYTIDRFGNTNSFTYDVLGRVIQTISANGLTNRTMYDVLGRAIYSTDHTLTNGTRTDYDSLGRVTSMTRLQGLQIGLVDDPNHSGQLTTALDSEGDPLSTTFTDYFEDGKVKSRTSADSQTTIYTYWDDGQTHTVTDPLNNVTAYEYDNSGRQKLVRDALGHTNHFEFDADGRLVRTIFHDGTYTSNFFNTLGQRAAQIDQATRQIDYGYDLSGLLTNVTMPTVLDPEAGNTTARPAWTYHYDDYSRQTATVDAKGHTNTLTYDQFGRQITHILPRGETETNIYNSQGQLWKRIDFKGQTNEFVYDKFGRVKAKFYFANGSIYPSNAVCYKYNGLGQLEQITERSGDGVTTNSCDGYTALVGFGDREYALLPTARKIKLALSRSALLDQVRLLDSTSEDSALSSMPPSPIRGSWRSDFKGIVECAYVPFGLLLVCLIIRVLPQKLKHLMLFFLIRGGWRMSHIPVPQVRRLYLPSIWNRAISLLLIAALFASDPKLQVLWSARADCTLPENGSTDTNRITAFAYDFEGHLTQVNCPEGVINYEYDLLTGRHMGTCTTNSYQQFSYDELGRLKTVKVLKRNGVSVNPPEIITYTYTAVGSRESVTLPNGIITAYQYDSLNRLTNLTHSVGGTNLLASYSYQLHPTGRRTNAVELIKQEDNSWLTNILSWRYDGMYRLTNEVSISSSLGGYGTYTNVFQYDKVGNRFAKVHYQNGTTTTITNLFNENDQLLTEVTMVGTSLTETNSYLYNLNGSLTAKTNISNTGTTKALYAYNLMNKMSAVTQSDGTTTSFLYNDQGIRVRSSTAGGGTTHFLIDAHTHTGYAQILEELSSPGATASKSYVIGDDVVGQCGNSITDPRWLLYDGHGSTRQLSNPATGIAAVLNYDAYGNGLDNSTHPDDTGLRYCGEQFDSSLAMYNLRARYYDPRTGTFNALDSFKGSDQDPPSLHKYAFCHEDPVNGKDPSGHENLISLLAVVTIAMMISAQYANAPGVGDKGLRNNDEATIALTFIEGKFVAVPVAYVGKLLVGKLLAVFMKISRYAGSRLSNLWMKAIVHHATTAAQSIIKGIDPTKFSPSSRFGRAFYVAEEGGTAIAEAENVTEVVSFDMNLGGQTVLDLTDPAVSAEWGYVASAGRQATQAIAERAIQEGYTVIKFYSVEVPGSVNYAIFENFQQILTNPRVTIVPWTSGPTPSP